MGGSLVISGGQLLLLLVKLVTAAPATGGYAAAKVKVFTAVNHSHTYLKVVIAKKIRIKGNFLFLPSYIFASQLSLSIIR